MKTYCKNMKITRETVAAGYEMWASGEAGRENAWRVEDEHGSADALIDEIAREISGRCLGCRPIRYVPGIDHNNGKRRIYAVQSVKQQVLDYTVYACIEGMATARLGFYQLAGVKGKGGNLGLRRVRKWVSRCRYAAQGDVYHCYEEQPQDVVMEWYRRHVGSEDVLYVVGFILGTYRKGLNIGSYFSLYTMSLLLSDAYHFIESLGKRRRGRWKPLARHQAWHLDDVLLVGDDKRDLKRAMRALDRWLRENLGLHLKPWKVVDLREQPVTMLGYTFRPSRVRVADRTFLRARRAFRRFSRRPSLGLARRAVSYNGWFKHADTWTFRDENGVFGAVRRARKMVSDYDRRMAACSKPL